MQKPSIGRVVHFVNVNGEHCAAIVTYVWSDMCINLAWFTPNGEPGRATSVVLDESTTPGTYSWHWPERV